MSEVINPIIIKRQTYLSLFKDGVADGLLNGNIDDDKARMEFPLNNRFFCEGVDVWITHIGGYPDKYNQAIREEITKNPPKVFICGHSHILKVQFDKKLNLLHMNPGACGKYGFHQVRTILRFEIEGDKIQSLEVIELGKK